MKQIFELPSCSLSIEHRMSYLYAVATGTRETKETCKHIWKHILTECRSNKHNKILFERDIDGIGSISELRELIGELAEVLDDEYIAYLDKNPEHIQTNRLAEMIASNLNFNVKFFTSIGEAKEWLLLK